MAAISRLYFSGRPAYIPWSIRAIIVNSVEACIVWARPDVSQKPLKILKLFSEVNTPAAIMSIGGTYGIFTPLLDPKPNLIFAAV